MAQQQERVTERMQGGAQALRTRLAHFFREVRTELNKVTWPNRAELTALTVLVLVLVVALAIYIGVLLDQTFSWAFKQLLGGP
jgi:preprotein translocase SecE subunit